MRGYGFWALEPLRRYADFRGRARRQEFWSFTILVWIVAAGLDRLDDLLGLADDRAGWVLGSGGVLGAAFSLATLVPSLAVSVRRVHDIGRSGWWLVVPAAVLIGSVLATDAIIGGPDSLDGSEVGTFALLATLVGSLLTLLILVCLDGTRGPNRFGPDPKRDPIVGVFD